MRRNFHRLQEAINVVVVFAEVVFGVITNITANDGSPEELLVEFVGILRVTLVGVETFSGRNAFIKRMRFLRLRKHDGLDFVQLAQVIHFLGLENSLVAELQLATLGPGFGLLHKLKVLWMQRLFFVEGNLLLHDLLHSQVQALQVFLDLRSDRLVVLSRVLSEELLLQFLGLLEVLQVCEVLVVEGIWSLKSIAHWTRVREVLCCEKLLFLRGELFFSVLCSYLHGKLFKILRLLIYFQIVLLNIK